MQSFRSEIENPVVEKDILELERKIQLFKEGKIDVLLSPAKAEAPTLKYPKEEIGIQRVFFSLPFILTGYIKVHHHFQICK